MAHPRLIANLSFQRAHGGGGAVSGAVYGGAVYSGGTGAASPKGEPRPQLKRSSSQQSLVFGQQGVWPPKNYQDECLCTGKWQSSKDQAAFLGQMAQLPLICKIRLGMPT